MPTFYYYLISSLPMLHFGIRPPFSFEKFLEACEKFIPAEDIRTIKTAVEKPGWFKFDTLLRNELVKVRAAHKRIDPAKYLRKETYAGPEIMHLALNAHRSPSILEAERTLDQARWQALDELSAGHFFDRDFLIIYALKLLILEHWERIRTYEREENRAHH